MPAPYDSKAVANFFLAKEPLTQSKLHKLIYHAHGWHLGLGKGPLLMEAIEAWRYGPVIPSLYEEFKEVGSGRVYGPARRNGSVVPEIDPNDRFVLGLLEKVWKLYGGFSAFRLSSKVRQTEGPWDLTERRNPGLDNVAISDKLMEDFFQRMVQRNRMAEQNRQRGSSGHGGA